METKERRSAAASSSSTDILLVKGSSNHEGHSFILHSFPFATKNKKGPPGKDLFGVDLYRSVSTV